MKDQNYDLKKTNAESNEPNINRLIMQYKMMKNSNLPIRLIFVFSFFMLPLLYGVFGSCVYTLRRFNSQMEIYGKIVSVHWKRIILWLTLGGLAGVIIGWLNLPSSGAFNVSTTSVTPFVLSLVAGYSMDTLFFLLESLLKSVPAPK